MAAAAATFQALLLVINSQLLWTAAEAQLYTYLLTYLLTYLHTLSFLWIN